MNLSTFIESNYKAAYVEMLKPEFKQDNEMQKMLRDQKFDEKLVTTWMRNYSLFRGITNLKRDKIVQKYKELVFDEANPLSAPPHRDRIYKMTCTFLTGFGNEVHRSWLSATSKLLWCSFPDNIVIYDKFVWTALVVLQDLASCLKNMPKIGSSPNVKQGIDGMVEFYMRYYDMVWAIANEHEKQLAALRSKNGKEYPHDIRIVDKLLWILGDPRSRIISKA